MGAGRPPTSGGVLAATEFRRGIGIHVCLTDLRVGQREVLRS